VPPFHLHQLRYLATSILKELGDMGKEQADFLADFWESTIQKTIKKGQPFG
jgi:hypothetical protein